MRTNPLILGFMAACLFVRPASAKDEAGQRQNTKADFQVTVYVSHPRYAPILIGKVAENTVLQLFARIGVSIRFIYTKPPMADTQAIALRIIEHAPDSLEPQVLGSASVACEHPEINVFCDRLVQFHCARDYREMGVLQGYAIAHELGHVLRADPGHSRDGIMRAYWKRTDADLMLQGVVSFCRADAERIRQVLEQRREKLSRAGKN